MLSKLGYMVLILMISIVTLGQTVSHIHGKVMGKNSTPIIGANVYIKDSYEGTSSDSEGQFSFITARTGSQVLMCSYLGFETCSLPVTLHGDSLFISISMQSSPLDMNEIVIVAGSFEAGGERKREVLKPLDIVTTAGATADIAGALNTLPGTMTVGESGRLFVRGGEGYETMTFIDGVQVQNFYGPTAPNTPSRSRFLPFMFRGTSFSTGGYSAEYGQALSSALILNSKSIAETDRIDVSLLSVGADISLTEAWDKASLSTKIQYTDIDPYFSIVKQDMDWIDPPTSIEGMMAFRKKLGTNGIVKLFGSINRSALSFFQEDLLNPKKHDPTSLRNTYNYLNATINLGLKSGWNLFGGLSTTYNLDNRTLGDDHQDEVDWGWHTKIGLKKQMSDHLSLNTGMELLHRKVRVKTQPMRPELVSQYGFFENVIGTYAELDIQLASPLLARAGLRSEIRGDDLTHYIMPRLSIAYKTGENSQISAAFGKFQQMPQKQWLLFWPNLDQEKATHYMLNYQISQQKRTFRIEAYFKNYDRLVKYKITDDPQLIEYSNKGHGMARGVDLFWRDNRTFNQIDYWIAYSFLDTYRDYLDYPFTAPPAYSSKHNVSIVYKHFVNLIKTQMGWTYTFSSGRPYEDPNFEGFLNHRTKPYHDLSINFSYLMRQNLIIHASVTNVLGRDHVFGYEYSDQLNADGYFPGRAIRLPAKRFLFLGAFWTISKEPILNQLPHL